MGTKLEKTATGRKSHVIWCPAGSLAFLPLHAAGLYDDSHGEKIFDHVVSSYTPSLPAFLRASSTKHAPSDVPGVLYITQLDQPHHHPGVLSLPCATGEAKILYKHLGSSMTRLDCAAATTSAALRAMCNHTWIHLACRGSQIAERPTDSAFFLYDNDLTLSTLTIQSNPDAELAFLSARETAGYKAVIGTMWSIRDEDAPFVIDMFYAKLLDDWRRGLMRGFDTGAAYALEEAVEKLKEKVGEYNFASWVPFVHFGI